MTDVTFYTQKIVDKFIKHDLCQDDDVLYKYYETGQTRKFKARATRLYPEADFDNVVHTHVTDSIRDIIREIIGNLSEYMRPMGDLIISGGEAFNSYFEHEDRIVTTDIDTKFTPVFVLPNSTIVTPNNPKYFGYLQVTKLLLWDYLGKIIHDFQRKIKIRIQRLVINSKIGKVLGISFSNENLLSRRYTLINKKKQGNDEKVSEGNTLIDVELFAIDMKLRYFTKTHILGGILDIAFMRTFEIGSEVQYSRYLGVVMLNPITKKVTFDANILVASKKFLLEDLYLLNKLNLRPKKKSKDRRRMYIFAKKVLKVDVDSSDSIDTIFSKSIKKAPIPRQLVAKPRPKFTRQFLLRALRVNPMKYEDYTTTPREKVFTQYLYGVSGPVPPPGYRPTLSHYRFDTAKNIWVPDNRRTYIKNEYNARPINMPNNKPKIYLVDTLYGYNKERDAWMPKALVNKAAMIPFVGLKNKSFIKTA